MSRDRLYATHIRDAVAKIEAYRHEGRAAFLEEAMTQDAVIGNFEIIGEATKRLSAPLKATYPDVPWRAVAGFRDVLIHGSGGVDLVEVWNIIELHLPRLRVFVDEMLKSLPGPQAGPTG